jgi:PilZ domain
MVVPVPVERRQTPRQELGRVAKILTGKGAPARYCFVVNMSEGGVRITAKHFDLPSEFVLTFPGMGGSEEGTYKVIWRNGADVGAKLVSSISQNR